MYLAAEHICFIWVDSATCAKTSVPDTPSKKTNNMNQSHLAKKTNPQQQTKQNQKSVLLSFSYTTAQLQLKGFFLINF